MINLFQDLNFDAATEANLKLWLDGDYDADTKAEILEKLKTDPKRIQDAFYTSLSFGTGGLRGIMGVGSNRMNNYTVRAATQGLANYINQQPAPVNGHSVFIGYDSRINSREFAEEAAKVLAGNGIRVYLCPELRPTPFVSFGCRQLHCTAAIMVTASHNPPEYNGYKVYWSDGAQVLPPHDVGIIREVLLVDNPSKVKRIEDIASPLIQLVDPALDTAYIETNANLQLCPNENAKAGKDLKIVYTSLHGTGITLLPQTLKAWGFTNLHFVEKQIIPDGTFPTVRFPNPEEKSALQMGIDLLEDIQADILIATDPDADRVGVAVRHKGEVKLLNGNEIACICLNHVLESLSKKNNLNERTACVKTIVTTELFQAICDRYKVKCDNVLTGFKYIAEKIREWESTPNGYQFVFGAEESYGYLLGDQVRDKDAIISSALICEAASQAKQKGQTLIDVLHHIWKTYGLYIESLVSVQFSETKEGKERMALGMQRLKAAPPHKLGGVDVVAIDDYTTSERWNLSSSTKEILKHPKANMFVFWLSDASKVIARPSGTEPKIKLYCGTVSKKAHDLDLAAEEAKAHAKLILADLEHVLQSS